MAVDQFSLILATQLKETILFSGVTIEFSVYANIYIYKKPFLCTYSGSQLISTGTLKRLSSYNFETQNARIACNARSHTPTAAKNNHTNL